MATDPGDSKKYENNVDVGETKAEGNNTTATAHNTIIQYPKPPRRDDGKWMAIGSIAGTLAGMLFSKDLVDDAKDAEKRWRRLTDYFYDDGHTISQWADSLKDCDDKLHDALCKFAMCGYKADYEGILSRARSAAKVAAAQSWKQAIRTADRYHTGINCDVLSEIRRNEITATVMASTRAFELERTNAFDRQFEILAKTVNIFEKDFLNRKGLAADFLAGAGQNYGYLAQSLRETAKADVGDLQMLGGMLALLIPILMGWSCDPDEYCKTGGDGDKPVTPPAGT